MSQEKIEDVLCAQGKRNRGALNTFVDPKEYATL